MAGFLNRPQFAVVWPEEAEAMGFRDTRQRYYMTEPLFYASDVLGDIVEIEKGFITDFGTVPAWALSFVDDEAPELLAPSIVHDKLYAVRGQLGEKKIDRLTADKVLAEAMRVMHGAAWKIALVYRAVRVGGAVNWNALPKYRLNWYTENGKQ